MRNNADRELLNLRLFRKLRKASKLSKMSRVIFSTVYRGRSISQKVNTSSKTGQDKKL